MTPALRCAWALVLMCLVVLLLPPEGALGEGLQVQQPRRPRAAYWLTTFSQLNKYIEKLFNGSLKSKDTKKSKDVKDPKKTSDSTKTPPVNTTKPLSTNAAKPPPQDHAKLPPRDSTNPPPRIYSKPEPPTSSWGPR